MANLNNENTTPMRNKKARDLSSMRKYFLPENLISYDHDHAVEEAIKAEKKTKTIIVNFRIGQIISYLPKGKSYSLFPTAQLGYVELPSSGAKKCFLRSSLEPEV